MHTASSKIWNCVTDSIFYDNNHRTKGMQFEGDEDSIARGKQLFIVIKQLDDFRIFQVYNDAKRISV